ncbi:MAG: hypothetical protein AAF586_08635 [Planctomycetota bacterium]
MVAIASCLFLALPARSLPAAFRELLFMRADDAIVDRLEAEAKAVADQLNARHKVYVIAIGRQLEVEVNFLIDDDRGFTVAEMDALRRRFIEIAESFKQRAWVNVNITRDASQI